MRFRIQADLGNEIKGYVVPDNPAAISRVAVSVDGRRVAEVAASKIEPSLKRRGWHSTGQCLFVISEAIVPDLAEIDHLEIYDIDTNVLIHRRASQARSHVEERVFLVGTSINSENEIQTALFPHFRQCYFDINKLSEEVIDSILASQEVQSCFVTGNFIFRRYDSYFSAGKSLTLMLVHDPYVEMASRLFWLRERADIADDPTQSWRLGPLAEAASFSREYDYSEQRSLKRLFRMLPEPAYHLLHNPLTTQLGTRAPDERIGPAKSILAVEMLARVGLVGHRNYFAAFMESVLDRLGIVAEVPEPPRVAEEIQALADRLRGLSAARDMVNFDEVICDGVLRSVVKGWGT